MGAGPKPEGCGPRNSSGPAHVERIMLTLIDWIRAPRALRVLLMLMVASVTVLTVPAPSSAQVAPPTQPRILQ